MWTFISYFFFFSLLLGDDSSWITTTLWNCKKCFNITEPVIWLCMISHFLWLLDKWYTRYTSDRLWSCVFTLVFEDEIKDVAQKGEKGDQVTISLIISLQTSFIHEKLVLASNIWHHSVKSDFPAYLTSTFDSRKNNYTSPAVQSSTLSAKQKVSRYNYCSELKVEASRLQRPLMQLWTRC